MNFPYPCSRCGFCCLTRWCKIAVYTYEKRNPGQKAPADTPCPALGWESGSAGEGHTARCFMYAEATRLRPEKKEQLDAGFGIGKGCCVLAKVGTREGGMVDYASLSADLKRTCVLAVLTGQAQVMAKKGKRG